MNEKLKDQIITIASDVFNVPKTEIGLKTSIGDLENWDSLGHLNFILEIESRLNVNFTSEKIILIKSIKDIIEDIEANLV